MDSGSKISWEFLRNITETLDSYRIRVLIDAKQEILDSGIYTEDQYYNIIFKMIDEDYLKYSLFNYLTNHSKNNYKSLQDFCHINSIDLRKGLSLLELLKNEGLLELNIIYDNVEEDGENNTNATFKDYEIQLTNLKPSEKKTIYEPVKVIFDSKNCSGCGLCAGICPLNCVNVYNGFGKLDEDKCIRCGLCYYVCPRSYLPVNLLNMTQEITSEFKNYSTIGYFMEAYSARTKIKEIADKCQDGGISSTCLYYLFDKNEIDIALGAQMSTTPWRPEPLLIKNKKDVLLSSGTKYVSNPTLRLLNQLNGNQGKLAIVGVPCMMQALLKSEVYNINIPSLNQVKYKIGIFCMESFSYESFLNICKVLNVDVKDVKKTDINKGKFFVYTQDGKELTVPIKEVTNLAREDCEACFDLTSESADISIGSTGSPNGWNTVLIRTQKGKELFDALVKNKLIESKDIKDVKPGLPMVEKIATSKRNTCYKHLAKKKEENKRIPSY